MTNTFTIMDRHIEAPREHSGAGRVVLSRLSAGRSPIGAHGPSVKIVLEGEGFYEFEGRSICVKPGSFLYLEGGIGCTMTHRSDLVGLCLILPTEPSERSSAFRPVAPGNDPVLGRALVLSTRTSAMGRGLEEYSRRIARDPAMGYHLGEDLLGQVTRAIRAPLQDSRAAMEGLKVAKPSTRRELFQRLERARGHLHANDSRAVSLTELASIAGLSQFHLARYFKLAFGEAPIAYHRALRLDRAAELLATESRPLTQIAEMTGYSDEVALSHAFRRRYGQPPQLWAMGRRDS